MSNPAIDWAITVTGISVPEKFVLVVLANRADSLAIAWPSISTIIADTGLSERAVQRALAGLCRGCLIIANRRGGRALTGRYTLQIPATQSPFVVSERVPDLHERVPEMTERVPDLMLNGDCVAPEPLRETKEPKEPKRRTRVTQEKLDLGLPPWMPERAWNDYVEGRRQKKNPLTAKAIELLIHQLTEYHERGVDIGAALDASTAAGWSGVFEPKARLNGNGRTHARSPSDQNRMDHLSAMGLLDEPTTEEFIDAT